VFFSSFFGFLNLIGGRFLINLRGTLYTLVKSFSFGKVQTCGA